MRSWLLSSSILAALSLSACGGGGSNSGVATLPAPPPVSTPSPPVPPTPITKPTNENFDTAELRQSNAAVASNAIQAYQAGASGAGVKVGVVDTGLNPNLVEFAGRIDPASRDVVGGRPMQDVYGHGTAVASIIAGARNDAATHGIAFNATIVMMKADAPGSCPSNCYFVNIADAIDAARVAGARVINLSIGGDARSDITDAVRRAAQAGMVIVIGAGNNTSLNPTGLAQSIAAAAPGQVIIVGALGAGSGSEITYNQLLHYSNQAGNSAGSFLTAPGYLINVVVPSGGVDQLSGTSFSAPVVTGAIALLAEAFPHLTARQLVQLLMATADDIGSTGPDSTYGQGRLNIGRAFQPIGRTNLAGSMTPVSTNANGTLPAGAGDAATSRYLRAVVLDAYQRAFEINIASTLRRSDEARPLERSIALMPVHYGAKLGRFQVSIGLEPVRFAKQTADEGSVKPDLLATSIMFQPSKSGAYAFGVGVPAQLLSKAMNESSAGSFFVNGDDTQVGFETMARTAFVAREGFRNMSLTWSAELGTVPRHGKSGAPAAYKLTRLAIANREKHRQVSIQISHLAEDATVLGGSLGEVFGRKGANTTELALETGLELGHGISATALMRRGWTVFGAGILSTSAYSLTLTKSGIQSREDQLSIRVSQPIRIDRGGASMVLPTSYDYETGSASYSTSFLPLSPHGREVTAEAAYFRRFGRGSFNANAFARLNPGHAADKRPDFGGSVRIAASF